MASVKRSTRPSRWISSSRGKSSGARARMRCSPPYATSIPKAPPIAASKKLSASICCSNCRTPAPSAERMESSCFLEVALPSSKFAMLTQPISSTVATASSINCNPRRERLVICSCRGTRAASSSILSGACRARSAWAAFNCASAWLRETPGRRRAMHM
jgi:hypothetical protein